MSYSDPEINNWAKALSRSPIRNRVIEITIYGRTPSKKNSRLTFARGNKIINIPSKAYAEWHKIAMETMHGYSGGVINNIEKITLCFYAPDKRATDLSNKAESIMDLLVDKGILEDDNWFIVPRLSLEFKGIDRDNPRCEVFIERAASND